MSHNRSRWVRRFVLTAAFAVLCAAVVLTAVSDVSADNSNPGVLPPNSNAFGQSYGEWAADWWTWAVGSGAAPLQDATGDDCAVGQSGKVWFLAGSWIGPVERSCTVPAGKALFFPLQNIAFFGFPDDPWPYSPYADEEDARVGLAAQNDDSGGRSATIDGVAIQDLDDYRVTSPVFGAQWPGWIYLYPMVDDGWYLMLAPLSEGAHTVEFTGWDGGQDVKYNLTIVDEE